MKACCRHCRHFVDDAAEFERELPGILALSSGAGDTRGDQGLCRRYLCMALPTMECKFFEPRRGTIQPRSPQEAGLKNTSRHDNENSNTLNGGA